MEPQLVTRLSRHGCSVRRTASCENFGKASGNLHVEGPYPYLGGQAELAAKVQGNDSFWNKKKRGSGRPELRCC
jgi:hypothetical protein